MSIPEHLRLSDDAEIALARDRLLHFCRQEYDYYDGLPPGNPDHIEPYDVLATVSVNSFITNAAQVREIHQGMAAACNGLLSAIPVDSDLLNCSSSSSTLDDVEKLLHAAVQVHRVLIPVATKILHRKRPNLIPMLDNVLLGFYLNANGRNDLLSRTQDKRRAAGVAMTVLDYFREHLQSVLPRIKLLKKKAAQEGYTLTPVRILEMLVWMATEERGYYRKD